MHTDRILRLADIIERETRPFDMDAWDACIAGFCTRYLEQVAGAAATARIGRRFQHPSDVGRTALGLTVDEEMALFTGPRSATRARAAQVLRHFAATGEVNWHDPTADPRPDPRQFSLFERLLARVGRQERTVRRLEGEAQAAAETEAA